MTIRVITFFVTSSLIVFFPQELLSMVNNDNSTDSHSNIAAQSKCHVCSVHIILARRARFRWVKSHSATVAVGTVYRDIRRSLACLPLAECDAIFRAPLLNGRLSTDVATTTGARMSTAAVTWLDPCDVITASKCFRVEVLMADVRCIHTA